MGTPVQAEPVVARPDRLLRERMRELYGTAAQRPDRYVGGSEAWIHDIRVSARRLEAALALFRPTLPPRRCREVLARAKKLRRTLGACRELDVIAEELRGLAVRMGLPSDVLAPVEAAFQKKQDKAIKRAVNAYPKGRIKQHRKKALALVPGTETRLQDLAAAHIYDRCEAVAQRIPAMDDDQAAAEHHRLRIRIKQLRYALELAEFQLVAELDVKSCLKQLKKLQDALGRLNDAVDVIDHIRAHEMPGPDPATWVAEAELVRAERLRFARGLVAQNLPALLGRIRRSAGRTGQIDLARA